MEDLVGVSTGLAWTEVGGELLSIEAVTVPGKGKVTSTGKLGEVMKESIQAAEYYIKSRSGDFGIDPEMVTAIVSVLTKNPIRRDVAMTGEITLRGRVFPIGGLKEKLLAALRGSIKTVLIPKDNEKDLVEIPDNVKRGIEIIPVETVEDVLKHALTEEFHPIGIEGEASVETSRSSHSDEDHSGVVTH